MPLADRPDRSGESCAVDEDPLRSKLLALPPLRDLDFITGASSRVGFAAGDVVQKEGQEVAAIHFPLSGMLSLLVVLKGGRTLDRSPRGPWIAHILIRGFPEAGCRQHHND